MIMLDAQSKDMMNYTHKAHAHTTVYNVPSNSTESKLEASGYPI